MKYVLVVLYLFTNADGDLQQTKFEMDFDTRQGCLAAIEETEAKVLSRVDARALTLTCRPKTPWDDSVSWTEYMRDDIRFASE